MYTTKNFKTKKELREAFDSGAVIRTFQPNADIFERSMPVKTGKVYLEGPHYPQPHRWYASGEVVDGILLKLEGKPPKNQEGVRAYFATNVANAAQHLAEVSK